MRQCSGGWNAHTLLFKLYVINLYYILKYDIGVTMWFTLLIPLLTSIFGESGPVGTYLKTKQQQIQAQEDYKLAALKANTDMVIQQTVSDTTQRANYLGATSQGFRQGTFYWMSAIILYSIIFPSRAADMWHNFDLIPQWVQYIYVAMLSVTWGLPIVKENIGLLFSSIGRGLDARMERKVQKINALNDAKFFASIRKSMGGGVDQKTVDMLNKAIAEGEAQDGTSI